jgi:gliding motility-associated-like protein
MNMKYFKTSFLGLFFVTNYLFSQSPVVWHFGGTDYTQPSGNVLDFKVDPPAFTTAPASNSRQVSREGAATVATTDGRTLFYTNGSYLWDGFGNEVTTTMNGANSSATVLTQGVPNNDQKFYVFTGGGNTSDDGNAKSGLNYHVVDFSGGAPVMEFENVSLNIGTGVSADEIEKFEVVPVDPTNENGDFWLIALRFTSGQGQQLKGGLYAFKFHTQSGVVDAPEVSSLIFNTSWGYNTLGGMSVSPNGDKIAFGDGRYFWSVQFNKVSGLFTNPIKVDADLTDISYGSAFSPSGQYLYVSSLNQGLTYGVRRFDLSTYNQTAIRNSKLIINSGRHGDLKLGPDGRIYSLSLSNVNGPADGISVINTPDDVDPGFVKNVHTLTGQQAAFGLSRWKISAVEVCVPPTVAGISSVPNPAEVCEGDPVVLTATANAGYHYSWKNAAGTEVLAGVDETELTLTAVQSTSYTVTISDDGYLGQVGCFIESVSKDVEIKEIPTFGSEVLAGPELVCINSQDVDYEIENPQAGATYDWRLTGANDGGETNTTIQIDFLDTPAVLEATITKDGCEGVTISKSIAIEELPVIDLTNNPIVVGCESGSNTAVINNASSYTYSVTEPNAFNASLNGGGIDFTVGTADGTFELVAQSLLVVATCQSKETVNIDVIGCEVLVSSGPAVICPEETTTFTTSTIETGVTIVSHSWSIDGNGVIEGGTTGPSLVVKGVNASISTAVDITASAEVTLEKDGQQVIVTTKGIATVNPLPDATGTIGSESEVCSGGSIAALSYSEAGLIYSWSSSDAGVDISSPLSRATAVSFPIITGETAELVSIDLRLGLLTNGVTCNAEVTPYEVTIHPLPSFTVADVSMACGSVSTATVVGLPSSGSYEYTITSPSTKWVTSVDNATGVLTLDASDPTLLTGGTFTVDIENTATGCVSSKNFEVALSGCGRGIDFEVTGGQCSGDEVTLKADVSTGSTGTITNYTWTLGSGVELVSGDLTGSLADVIVVRSLNQSTGIEAKEIGLEVEFSDAPTNLVETKSNAFEVFPEVKVGDAKILGPTEICDGGNADYSLENFSGTGFEVVWSTSEAIPSTEKGNGVMNYEFSTTVLTGNSVDLFASVVDANGCASIDSATTTVSTEDLPDVTLSPIDILCGSVDNSITIENHAELAPVIYNVSSLSFDSIRVDNTTGVITFNAGGEQSNADLIVTATSGGCSSASPSTVAIDVLGCSVSIDGDQEKVCSSEGIVFTTNEDDSRVVDYTWSVDVEGVVSTATTTSPSYTWPGFENNTGVDLTLKATVAVRYSTTTGSIVSGNEYEAIIYTTPDWEFPLNLVRDGQVQGDCVDDINEFQIIDKDNSNTDLVYEIGFVNPSVDAQLNYTNGVDTMNVTSKSQNYTIQGSLHDSTKSNSSDAFCYVRDTESVAVVVVPSVPFIIGNSRTCEQTTTLDDYTVEYVIAENSDFDVVEWYASDLLGDEVVEVQNYTTGKDNLGNDTLALEVIDVTSMNREFVISAKVEFLGACEFTDSITVVLFVDTTYKVAYEISPSSLFCEGDEGYFSVRLDTAVGDVYDQFDRYSLHMWTYNEDTIKRGNLSQEIYAGTDSSYQSYYAELYTPTDTIVEWDSLPSRVDTSWSTVIGPFATDDTVYFSAEPLFCWHKDSKLSDTLAVSAQEEPILNLILESPDGEASNSLDLGKIDSLPNLVLYDENNSVGFSGYVYETGYINPFEDDLQTDGVSDPLSADKLETSLILPKGINPVSYVTTLSYGSCQVTDTATVTYEYDIYNPTGITPDGNGEHDVWVIRNIENFPNANVKIYNRWGSLLFESNDYINEQWDGTYEGEELPVASYYYIIDLGNGADLLSGAISIFR